MTDAAFAYHEDVATRAIQKKSALHKKNGPAVAKLGNKPMTNKEIAEKHGPVESYDLNKFMDFSTFKSMPHDLQIEYINRLQDKYDIGLMQISKNLFNLDNEGLRTHLRINKILDKCKPNVKRGKTGYRKFLEDMDEQRRQEEFAKIIDISEARNQEDGFAVPEGFIEYPVYLKFDAEKRLDYINGIIRKYEVSVYCISEILFGKDRSTVYTDFVSKKMQHKIIKLSLRNGVIYQMKIEAFKMAVKNWKEGKTESAVIELPIIEPAPEPVTEPAISEEKHQEPEIVPEEKPKKKAVKKQEPASEEKPSESPDAYHDTSYTSSYVREGLDMIELQALSLLFQGKKVRVDIRIVEVA